MKKTAIVCIMMLPEFLMFGKMALSRLKKNRKIMSVIHYGIRGFTFFFYLAVYCALPYGAIIIRECGESFLGISAQTIAGFPVFLFCIGIIISQLTGQKIIQKIGYSKYVLIMSLLGIVPSALCFFHTGIPEVIFSSFGLGLCAGCERAFMNNIIPLCSDSAEKLDKNYGFFNAGLLSGLTFGGSLGGAALQFKGYGAVYGTSCLIMLAAVVLGLLFMPLDYFEKISLEKETKTIKKSSAIQLLKSPKLAAGLIITCPPLNLGLMFIVSFVPVFIAANNLPSAANSYVYLLYGISGSYGGVMLISLMRKVSSNKNAFLSMLLIAASILILMNGASVRALILSTFAAGLFDGFGSAAAAGSFVNSDYADGSDKTALLTAFSILGGIISSLSSFIYGFIINGENVRLAFLAAYFIFSGILILNINKKAQRSKQNIS